MAQRRMFSLKIVDTDLFLDMPLTARLLYYDLSMRADDDGFVASPKKIQRMIGCSDDDMKLLIAKKFVIPFESGICVISHWRIHNYIQKDRYTPTMYQYEKAMLKEENGTYETMDTNCIQNVSKMDTQVRLGKDRLELGKDSIDENIEKPPKEIKHKYGEFNHVRLTETEYNKLLQEYGQDKILLFIKKVDEYCEEHGKSYKNYNLTIRKWISNDKSKPVQQGKQSRFNAYKQREYDSSIEEKLLSKNDDIDTSEAMKFLNSRKGN